MTMPQSLTSVKFPRSGGHYTLKRAGQERPDTSDLVVVEATVLLPDNREDRGEGTWHLHPNIRFGNRICVATENLSQYWGDTSPQGPYRQRGKLFPATTWPEAFETAQAWAMAELGRLETALESRAAALAAAEQDA